MPLDDIDTGVLAPTTFVQGQKGKTWNLCDSSLAGGVDDQPPSDQAVVLQAQAILLDL